MKATGMDLRSLRRVIAEVQEAGIPAVSLLPGDVAEGDAVSRAMLAGAKAAEERTVGAVGTKVDRARLRRTPEWNRAGRWAVVDCTPLGQPSGICWQVVDRESGEVVHAGHSWSAAMAEMCRLFKEDEVAGR